MRTAKGKKGRRGGVCVHEASPVLLYAVFEGVFEDQLLAVAPAQASGPLLGLKPVSDEGSQVRGRYGWRNELHRTIYEVQPKTREFQWEKPELEPTE